MLSNDAFTSFESIKFGRGSKNRTHDTRFWRPLLYQLSYAPIQKRSPEVSLFLVGL